MKTLLPIGFVVALAAWGPARAETQILFLTEDVPAGLDMDGPTGSTNTSQTGFINMSEPLVYYAYGPANEEGVRTLDLGKFEGRLAESWEFDPESLTWTMHLRHGVKSCAGNEFTAADVVYSFARAKSVSGQAPTGWFVASIGSIAGFTRDVFKPGADRSLGDAVTKVDDYTVKIRQSQPNRLFLTTLSIYADYPYDSVEMKKHATEQDPWSHVYVNTQNVPSFGAYCLERWVRDDEFVLRANPAYYRGKPAIDRIVIKKVPQTANRTMTLRSLQADLTQRLTTREYNGLRTASGVTVAGIYGNEVLSVGLNFKTPPFDNPKLRQAIAYAIPYEQIARVGYAGAARKMEGQYPRVEHDYMRPATQYATDPAKAKALLAEAGFPDGKGLEKYPDSFRLAYTAEREATLGPIATVIQSALRDVGIPIELDPMPQTQISDRRLVKKDLPMALNDIEKAVGPDVTYATQLYFVSPAVGALNNFVNYNNPEVDRLFREALAELDDAKRTPMVRQIQEIVQQDLAWVPLAETKTEYAFRSNLKGITWHPENSVHFIDLSLQN
jgi:peptide/nickel transport system substrate-binding protein